MGTNKEVAESLKQFHKRILKTNLCSKIFDQEIMAIIEATDLLELSSPVDINDELYEVAKYDLKYIIYYGYVSSIRKDKEGKWHFRYTYYREWNGDPLNPTKFHKNENVNKSLHEASIDELYDGTTYTNKSYYRNLNDAQKVVRMLQEEYNNFLQKEGDKEEDEDSL